VTDPKPADDLDWDRARDGKMADYATDDEPETVPYDDSDETD
jgi:hypothetical protein